MSTSPPLLDYHQGLKYDKLLPSPPLLLSQGHWQGLVLEHHDAPLWEMPEYYASHHHIGVLLDEWHGEQCIDGHRRSERAPEGSVCIIPARLPFASRWHNRSQAVVLAVDPALLGRVAHEAVECDRIELNFCWLNNGDPFISQILHQLKADTEAGHPIGPIYGESLATALAAICSGTMQPCPPPCRCTPEKCLSTGYFLSWNTLTPISRTPSVCRSWPMSQP